MASRNVPFETGPHSVFGLSNTNSNANANTSTSTSWKSKFNVAFPQVRIDYDKNTKRITGEDHNPIFECVVEFQGKTYCGKSGSKKGAQEECVRSILKQMRAPEQLCAADLKLAPKEQKPMPSGKLIFVDLDNKPNIHRHEELCKNNSVYGFTSTFSDLHEKRILYEAAGVKFYSIDSSAKNAADVFLIVTLYGVLLNYMRSGNGISRNPEIVILTGDKFGVALKDVLCELGFKDIRHVVRINDI